MKLLSNQESLIGKLRVAHVQVGTKKGYIALKEIRKPTTNVMDAEKQQSEIWKDLLMVW